MNFFSSLAFKNILQKLSDMVYGDVCYDYRYRLFMTDWIITTNY